MRSILYINVADAFDVADITDTLDVADIDDQPSTRFRA